MQPSPHMTTKECECGARMVWTSRGLFVTRWRLECLCGRAGPWRYQPEYRKPGPPPIMGGPLSMVMLREPPPFEKAERALWGQKWTADQADKLRDLIGWGEAAGTQPMTLPPERIGDKGQRFVVQTTGWPNHDAMGWQNAAYADTQEAATKAMQAIGKCPGVKHIRIRDRAPEIKT